MKPALLVIDVQKDYFPGGKMEQVEMRIAALKGTLAEVLNLEGYIKRIR